MIRHIAMITFIEGVTDAEVSRIENALASLPARIPQIVDYAFGRDLDLDDANADFVIVGDFATVEDYRTYVEHPDHVAVLATEIKPVAASVARIQITLPG